MKKGKSKAPDLRKKGSPASLGMSQGHSKSNMQKMKGRGGKRGG